MASLCLVIDLEKNKINQIVSIYSFFAGQMLMKWFISSLQINYNHFSEQDISMLTLQYCNNLINVGVLKQISEKNDLETFKVRYRIIKNNLGHYCDLPIAKVQMLSER